MRTRIICSVLLIAASVLSSVPLEAQDCLRAGIAWCDAIIPDDGFLLLSLRGWCYLSYLNCEYLL